MAVDQEFMYTGLTGTRLADRMKGQTGGRNGRQKGRKGGRTEWGGLADGGKMGGQKGRQTGWTDWRNCGRRVDSRTEGRVQGQTGGRGGWTEGADGQRTDGRKAGRRKPVCYQPPPSLAEIASIRFPNPHATLFAMFEINANTFFGTSSLPVFSHGVVQ